MSIHILAQQTQTDALEHVGIIANALGGGGDRGNAFPESDCRDLRNGAWFIPGEVTIARRQGKLVTYNRETRTWTFPDGGTLQDTGEAIVKTPANPVEAEFRKRLAEADEECSHVCEKTHDYQRAIEERMRKYDEAYVRKCAHQEAEGDDPSVPPVID